MHMQVCKYASMHVHANMQERACPYPRLRDFYVYNKNEPVSYCIPYCIPYCVLYCILYELYSINPNLPDGMYEFPASKEYWTPNYIEYAIPTSFVGKLP